MTNLTHVSEQLLTANHLNQQDLFNVLSNMSDRRLDYADIYFQSYYSESWVIEDSLIKEGAFNIEQGVGIRAISGEKTGFAYADQITLNALMQSGQAARSITREQGDGKIHTFAKVDYTNRYSTIDPLHSLSREDKIALLHRADKLARASDKRVKEVTASLSGVYELVLIAATDGTLAADIRPLVRMNVSVLVEDNGRRERGSAGGGGRYGYEYFMQDNTGESLVDSYVRQAVKIALVNLSAVAAPAGTMPVILGSGWPGVLLHEAVGHGLEGDFNRRKLSVFSGKIGEKVTSALCTIVDDGTLNNRRGSISIDDEGVPSQYNILVENGILKGYMQDKLNARLMGMTPTGNGRRESYSYLPIPRMTNTYMLAGQSTPEEIISSVDFGIYAPHFAGGQVDITSGKFVFTTAEAWLIEKGKLIKPVKGATLIGSGIEAMQQVSMVGHDLCLDSGVGICGKEGQSVPVGVGQPTIKLDSITVGGTS